ncbi:hypothetical protein M2428_004518 [Arthrobacter sp. ES3-54]|nr:hypothetical protein [Arthrobacter sp. ES3-54]
MRPHGQGNRLVQWGPDEMRTRVSTKGFVRLPLKGDIFIDHEQHRDADFSGPEIKHFSSYGSRFENCNFESLRPESWSFSSGEVLSEYVNCSFDGGRFPNTIVGRARFIGCSFRRVRMKSFALSAGDLIDSTFSGGIDLLQLWGTTGADADIYGDRTNVVKGNDFSEADIADPDFRFGVDLRQQKLPIGQDYLFVPDAAQVLARAYRAAVALEDLEQRRKLLSMIQTSQRSVESGQRDDFLSKRRLPRSLRETYELYFGFLSGHLTRKGSA